MIREIVLCGQRVNYTLQYKDVKNINLRVRKGGEVFVSASKRVGSDKIDAFLRSKEKWIISAIEKMKSKEDKTDASGVLLFGERIPLTVREGSKNTLSLDENGFCLVLKNISDSEGREKLLRAFYKREAERVIFPICKTAYKTFSIKNLAFPEIKYRYMKTRWGSCHTKKGILTFNTALAKAPLPAIEYVVFHEFTHFLHPDHSREFYETLSRFMHDYKARKRLLKEVSI
jgi:predicted metal-dependent hydrolase